MIESRSPQDPTDVVVSAREATPSDVASAAEKARAAGRDWAAAPATVRAAALSEAAAGVEAVAEELTSLMVREVGKPIGEARGEVARSVAILRYNAQQALDPDGEVIPAAEQLTLLHTRRRPRGVAGLITPWNFPLAIPLWKAAPALAFGNAVLVKPSPEASASMLRLSEVLNRSLPDGLLTVVTGGGETGQAVVDQVDVVSFTGSVGVGRMVAASAATRAIPYQTEMGGLNASIVMPDANIERAAAVIAGAAMAFAGQKCTATSRVLVVGDPQPFTDALVAAVERLPVGDPTEAATAVGPLILESARDRVIAAADQARAAGGRVLTGGSALEREGWFVQPTLVDGLEPDAQLRRDEVFGPVCTIIPARDSNEAVRINNEVRYGLVTSVFTRDLDAALRAIEGIDTGLIRINAATSGVDFHAPFGGQKESSAGPREQGKAARELYTSLRTITISAEAR